MRAHIKDKLTSASITQHHAKFRRTPGHKDGNSDGKRLFRPLESAITTAMAQLNWRHTNVIAGTQRGGLGHHQRELILSGETSSC